MDAKEDRLTKRWWLIKNFDHIVEESSYYRLHRENFLYPRIELWKLGTEEGRCAYDIAEG